MNLSLLIVALVSFIAAAVNSVAGGGTFLSFPTLTGVAGLSEKLANMVNTIGLWPGQAASVAAAKQDLARLPRGMVVTFGAISLGGGIGGAILLLETSPKTFSLLIPWLLAFATIIFGFSKPIARWAGRQHGDRSLRWTLFVAGVQAVVAIYGGYFGAGMGVLTLAGLAFAGLDDIHQMNAMKVLLTTIINGVAAVIFAFNLLVGHNPADHVDWRMPLAMAIAAIVGGVLGMQLARRIKQEQLRLVILLIGVTLTAAYFYKNYSMLFARKTFVMLIGGDIMPSMPDPLTRLAIKHGTDKWGPHFYAPRYHELFAARREMPVRLLEIGVGGYRYRQVGGASLAMWAEYFPAGRIVGIDNEQKSLELGPRITVLHGSQIDVEFLNRVVADHGPFDIIIDDGSHQPEQVAATFMALFPTLAHGGLYVVEDVQTAYWPAFGGAQNGAQTVGLALGALHMLNHAEIRAAHPQVDIPDLASTIRSFRAWHNLFVFEKGDNREPSIAQFDAANPHAREAREMVEAEVTHTPTAAACALLVEVYRVANEPAKALRAAQEALDRWPDSIPLLTSAARAAGLAGQPQLQRGYLERATALDPQCPGLREVLAALNPAPSGQL